MKFLKRLLVKLVPLSVINRDGEPNKLKNVLKTLILAFDFVLRTGDK